MIKDPFFTITLPLVLAIFIAAWLHNKHFDALNRRIDDLRAEMNHRLDEMSRRIDEMNRRMDEMLAVLHDLDRRVTRLEERSSPVVRG